MAPADAARLLGIALPSRNTEAWQTTTLRKAYRAAIRKAHPDAGGSPELAAEINKAHDVLKAYQPAVSVVSLFNNMGG